MRLLSGAFFLIFLSPLAVGQEATPPPEPADVSEQATQEQAPNSNPTDSSSKKKAAAQEAIVGPEGATVYAQPDFDSSALANLVGGYKVIISKRKFPGKSGLGAFFRIRYADKKLGFVADTEVIPQFARSGKAVKTNPEFKQVDEMRERALSGQEPIIMTRFFGASLGTFNYSFSFQGQKLSSNILMYGLRFTGPGVLFDGPPLDLHLLFSPKAPDAFQRVTGAPASGFLARADLGLQWPLFQGLNWLLGADLGVSTAYAKYRVRQGLDYLSEGGFQMGAVLGLGASYRQKKWLYKIDSKYYYEKSSSVGHWLSVQHEY